ncbi:hypothetical protein K439DRAFT_1277856, partial [Ramaria rubella]
ELLDASKLINHSQISTRFSEITQAIIYNHYLRVDHEGTSTDFEILEIEFYLYMDEVHSDPFCHAHDDQRISAQWYFHRAPRNTASTIRPTHSEAGGYRGGTRKGLDLTFGTPITSQFFPVPEVSLRLPQIRGGILLRTMKTVDGSGTVISGPSLLVDHILKITKSRNVSELVNVKLAGRISAIPPADAQSTALYLIPYSRGKSPLPIHRSPRVGLDLAHSSVVPRVTDPRVQYLSKLYRYFIRPELLKSNGRCHTLIGLLLEQCPAGQNQNPSLDCPILAARLMEMTSLQPTTLQRYINDFTQGFTKRSLAEYVGSAGKGASSNPQKFMRLMGVL